MKDYQLKVQHSLKLMLILMLISEIVFDLISMIFLFINCSLLNVNVFNRDRRTQPMTVRSDNKCRTGEIRIDGMRVLSADKSIEYDIEDIPELITRTHARLRLFGCGFTDQTVITFTRQSNERNGACLLPASGQFKVESDGLLEYTAVVDIIVPAAEESPYYICVKNAEDSVQEKVQNNPSIPTRLFIKLIMSITLLFIIAHFLIRKSTKRYRLYIREVTNG